MFGLSLEIVIAIGGLVATVISFLAGARSANHKANAKQAERDKDAILRRKELEDEVEKLPADDRRKRLGKWVREGK